MKEKYLQAKLKKRTCPICLEVFYVRYGGKRPVKIHGLNVRSRACYTCSAKCSKIRMRVSNQLRNMGLLK